jgi:hypothetical protein
VRACPVADCSTPTDVTTTANGLAEFPLLDGSALTVTAAPSALRTDGLPLHERASILGTTVTDIALPLRENPVRSNAGFSASISFSYVSTTGSYWAGFVTASASDVPSLTANGLLGENFQTEVPGINQQVPVPGAEALAYVRFTGVFVGAVGACYLWALAAGGTALRTVFQVTLIFRGGAGTFTGVGVAAGMFHPMWLAVTFTDLGLVAAQSWLLRKGFGRDA